MYNKNDFINDVLELIRMENLSEIDESECIAFSIEIIKKLKKQNDLLSKIPEEIWHFISDVDIRSKDSSYKIEQTKIILKTVYDWNK
ncbi:hypothetical protein [Edaphosphingomonas haloaromaticamans]|uniref:hypothetical protein n=1 Tax=Edaphosphingomonas haloaromaticamans TaxID=653954 RepID=UPI00111363AB|nr:hypothetical protein [Sphingomonas haloaromaticamans]